MNSIFEHNGIKFIEKDDLIVKILKDTKVDFEEKTTNWILSNLVKNKLFIDVGHSTGWFSLLAASNGFNVIGFEPMDIAYERALANMKLNGLSYELYNAAVSDTQGKTKIYHNPGVSITTGASLESTVRSKLNTDYKIVKTVRLDDIIESDDVCLVKIDVEGHELNVLNGAENLIRKNKPKLVLEANDEHHEKILATWLTEHSYRYEMVDSRNMLCTYDESLVA